MVRRIQHAIDRLSRWLHAKCYAWHWEHGCCTTSHAATPAHEAYTQTRPARRHRRTGEVQFVLWPKGYVLKEPDGSIRYTYPEDYWIAYDCSWWPGFSATPRSGDRCQCGHCGYEGLCHGVPHSGGVSAPYCPRCERNDRLSITP